MIDRIQATWILSPCQCAWCVLRVKWKSSRRERVCEMRTPKVKWNVKNEYAKHVMTAIEREKLLLSLMIPSQMITWLVWIATRAIFRKENSSDNEFGSSRFCVNCYKFQKVLTFFSLVHRTEDIQIILFLTDWNILDTTIARKNNINVLSIVKSLIW